MHPRDIPEIREAIDELEELTSYPLSIENAYDFGEVLAELEDCVRAQKDEEVEKFVGNIKKTYTRQLLRNMMGLESQDKMTDVYLMFLVTIFARCEKEYKELCNEIPEFIKEFTPHYQEWFKGKKEGERKK